MAKLILAYNFSGPRLQALKMVAMFLKVQLRPVAPVDLQQPLGYLAGLKGYEAAEVYTGPTEGLAEMLLLCGFDRPLLDRLLVAIKKSPLKQVALKAMLTPHNVSWSGLALLKELTEEHEAMNKQQVAHPQK